MKSVLMSIQPKWCDLIAQGKKTVEVRKTRPKITTPFKVYIYMTKNGNNFLGDGEKDWFVSYNFTMAGKVIGEFVCDEIEFFDSAFDEWARCVAPPESHIDSMGWNKFEDIIHNLACMTDEDLNSYFPEDVKAYMWHISDLVIYDEPKELSEFTKIKKLVDACELDCIKCDFCKIKKPPQSWCYVEEVTKNDNR